MLKCFLPDRSGQASTRSARDLSSRRKGRHKTWSIIHNLSDKKRQSSVKVKKRDGSDPIRQQDLLNERKEYFRALLNNTSDIDATRPPPAELDLPINTTPSTLEETKRAIKFFHKDGMASNKP